MRQLLALLPMLVAGAAPIAEVPTGVPPYGLECDRCQREPSMTCDRMEKMPVAAVVGDAIEAGERVRCTIENPEPGDHSECFSTRGWRFASVRYLRAPPKAGPQDVFQTASYFTWFERDAPRRGVVIEPGTRYVLLSGAAHPSIEPRASWRVSFACKLETDKH